VDGGGSKTAALLAIVDDSGDIRVIGHGRGGPSNLRLAGKEQSLASLNRAVDEAFVQAELPVRKLDYCVLALAGSTSPDVQRDVSNWARERELSSHIQILHDAVPVLAHGTADGWGIALIVGTGSVAVGVDRAGNSVTKGGWGHWFGDKGSGFYLGYKALAAVAEASDEIGPETILSDLVMEKLGTTDPRSILKEVSASGDTRREVAALAPMVLEAAGRNDAVALRTVNGAASEAAKLVDAVSRALKFNKPYPLALAGGVVCYSELFREKLISRLGRLQSPPGDINLVSKPVLGCLKIARTKLSEIGNQGPAI
jgi:N-acetylglucosamine kinase-like BadF-type ATPase